VRAAGGSPLLIVLSACCCALLLLWMVYCCAFVMSFVGGLLGFGFISTEMTLWTLDLWTVQTEKSKNVQSVQNGPNVSKVSKRSNVSNGIGIIFGEHLPLQKFFTRKLIVTKSEKFYLSALILVHPGANLQKFPSSRCPLICQVDIGHRFLWPLASYLALP
jgi:hypothetical protein